MAKLNKPLFSLTAFGQITRGLIVRRRGSAAVLEAKPYPKDAKTSAQLSWRTMYQLAITLWHSLSQAEKKAWESVATPHHMTGYAYFLSQALRPNPGIYLPLAGGTMSGPINMGSQKINTLATPTADADAATKKYVDDHVPASSIPAGLIAMWHGLLVNIPTGWNLCDGTNGTPDLRSKFVKGAAPAADPGAVGGALSHVHDDHAALVHAGANVNAHSAHSGAAVATHPAGTTGSPVDMYLANEYYGTGMPSRYHYHPTPALAHSVTQPSEHSNHTVTQPNNHAAQPHSSANNEPAYYAVAFIMKL